MRSAGQFKVTVTSAGKYSGTLQMAGGKYSFSGTFGTLCMATNMVLRKGTTTLVLNFSLNPNGSPNPFFGEYFGWDMDGGDAGRAGGVQCDHASGAVSAALIRWRCRTRISMRRSAVGNGYGSAKVDGSGNVKFSGALADGTKITQAAQLSADGDVATVCAAVQRKGLLMAWVSFANRPDR